MRSYWLALGGILLWSAAATAQQPTNPQAQPKQPVVQPTGGQPGTGQPATGQPATPPPAPPAVKLDPDKDPLDRLLVNWEAAMKDIDTLKADLSRTEENKTFGNTTVYVGTAKYLKPGFAMLETQKKDGKPNEFEKVIVNSQGFYQYAPAQQQINVHPLTENQAAQAGDNPLTFLFGMKAADAKGRYDLTLSKTDQYYFYVDVLPKSDADKADFQRAQLVLNKTTYLPRRLWFEQPNKDTVMWDVPKVETHVPLKKEDFTPTLPKDWKWEQPPKTIRP
jgi:TIGR03009 family protein